METYSCYAVAQWREPASGAIDTVTGFGAEVAEPLVSHERLRKISSTGSVKGGARVAAPGAKTNKSVWLSTAREIAAPF